MLYLQFDSAVRDADPSSQTGPNTAPHPPPPPGPDGDPTVTYAESSDTVKVVPAGSVTGQQLVQHRIQHCVRHSLARWAAHVQPERIFFGLVRIRPLRSVLTISEPWDEGNGFEYAKVDVARVVEPGFLRLPPPAPCRVSGPQARWATTAGGRLG